VQPPRLKAAPCDWQDISGFSQLNEYFAQLGGVGLGKMMALVNVYFQQMIKICSSCGGDVIKFAGDALIVLWTSEPLSKLAHRACECAMDLQDALHDVEMTPEIRLCLKVGVGSGSATMFYVGGHENRCEYFAAGPALKECFSAADAAEKGDVIVSSSVLNLVRGACSHDPTPSGHHRIQQMCQTFRKKAIPRSAPLLAPNACAVLRSYAPSVLVHAAALEARLRQPVRNWTVGVVQASVIFIHFGIEGVMDLLQLDCARIHQAVVTVQQRVHAMQGCIHRFTVDDKGCVMKVVFGADLPHEDQPYRALLTALHLRQALSLQGIQPAFGVASGTSLVGPVGGVVRQEFTVHGDRVVLAARLMQLAAKLGGMVLCDEATHDATRDEIRFVRLRPVCIKGKSELYRPYRPVASSEILEKPKLRDFLEEEYYPTPEAQLVLASCNDWPRAPVADDSGCTLLVIDGAYGAGKTQLLMQARAALERHATQREEQPAAGGGMSVVHVRCRAHEQAQHGALARRLFAQLCGYDVFPSLEHIVPMLHDSVGHESLDTEEQLLHVEMRLLTSARRAADSAEGGRQLAILIDDVHFADRHSCKLLQKLATASEGCVGAMLLMVTCRDERASLLSAMRSDEERVSAGRRLVHALTSRASCQAVTLQPLPAEACGQFACGVLGVETVPQTLIELLARRSGGKPLLCEALVRTCEARGLLVISSSQSSCCLSDRATPERLEAVATATIVAMSHSIHAVRLATVPILQQVVLKVLAVLPQPCTLAQLHSAIPFQIEVADLAAQLAELRSCQILQLAPTASRRRSVLDQGRRSDTSATTFVHRRASCLTERPPAAPAPAPDAYEFADVGMREVCEALMVESQRRQVHLQLATRLQAAAALGEQPVFGSSQRASRVLPSAPESLELAEMSNEELNDLVVSPTMLRRGGTQTSPPEHDDGKGSEHVEAPFRLPPSITQVSSPKSASREPKLKRESSNSVGDSSSCRYSGRFLLGGTLTVGGDSPLRDSLTASLRFSNPTPLRWARVSARRDDATRSPGGGSWRASPARSSPRNSPITPKPKAAGWSAGDRVSRGAVLKPSKGPRKLSKVSEVVGRWRFISSKRVCDLSNEQAPAGSQLNGPNEDVSRREALPHATLTVSTGPTGDGDAPSEQPSAFMTPHLAPALPPTPAVPHHLQHLDLTPASPPAASPPGAHGRPRAARKLDFSTAES
tara:strand:- start:557 stop:4195 length:3639 start_codon:yes stop_codon:yes gene_type:complete